MAPTISCPSCGREVQEGDHFCAGCGNAVTTPEESPGGPGHDAGTNPTQCLKCGAAMGREDAFCPQCGAARPEEATVVSHVSLRNTQAAHLIQSTAGEFEVIQEIGSGAMGAVYLARDVALSRQVAIKVIAPHLLSDETMISRFRLEAQTVASLRHPNIVNVHAVKQSDDLHYFVMEFIDGPPLRSIVKRHAPLPVDVVQGVLFQVGSALNYAHRKGGGVIHRDIKPANIMLDREGDAFVTDFGISKIAEVKTGLTQTGATIGTPEYMSPEQCRGEELTGASDQYALGIVAYEMLCGRTPFSGNQYHIMVAHTNEPPPPIRDVRPDCPPDVATAVERMLAKSPTDRWPDLNAAVTALGGAPLGFDDPTRTKIVALTASTLTQIPAISGTSPSGGGPITSETATKVSVTGLPPVIEAGDSFKLEADIEGVGGVSLSGLGVEWASTDSSIARVRGGIVETLQPGSVSITATAGDVASSVLLTVAEPAPAAVSVRPASVTIQRGGRIALTARVEDRRGGEMEREVIWRSSDPSVATVSEDGLVVATGTGPVTVRAECGAASGTAKVVVEVPATAEPAAVAGSVATQDVAASALDPTVVVPTSVPEVAAVDAPAAADRPKPTPPRPRYATEEGQPVYKRPAAIAAAVVGLLAVGYGVISLTGDGADEPLTGEPAPAQAGVGGGVDPQFEPATPPDQVVSQPADEPAPADDPAADPPADDPAPEPVAALPAQPEPAQPEPATQPEPDATADAEPVTPPPPPAPGSVVISVATPMAFGTVQSADAQVTSTAGGAMTPAQAGLAWRSSDTGVLAVNAQTGAIETRGTGTAYVVASAGNAADSVAITVEAVPAGVEITESDLTMQVGEPMALNARIVGSDGSAIAGSVAWSSANPGVATVDAVTGRLSGLTAGTTQVTASAAGFTDQITVTVEAAAPSAEATRAAIDAFVGLLNGGQEDAVRGAWSESDGDGLDDVLDLMGEPGFAAEVGQIGEPALAGSTASVSFDVSARYRNFAGANRERGLSLSGQLRSAGGSWQLVSVALR